MGLRAQDITEVTLDDGTLSLDALVAVARYRARVTFSPGFRQRVARSRALVEGFVDENRAVYGVTTGFGDNVTKAVSPADAEALQLNIVRTHAVSVGQPLEEDVVRAIQTMVLVSLGKGYSGVRMALLDQIAALLNAGVTPFAPGEGSVGYLAPEAHMALVLIGEGRAWYQGVLMPGGEALAKAGLSPLVLACKEGLALTNGTTSVTAIAALALAKARQAAKVADIAGAISLEALKGTLHAFDARYHAVKAHAEQAQTAAVFRRILAGSAIAVRNINYRLQDPYSLRCIPQVHGASKRAINDATRSIDEEMRSSGDNPIIVPVDDNDGIAISGANFDGTFVGMAADMLCIAQANLAKISERRTDRLVNSHFSELPPFLVRQPGLNSGYMIVQYTAAGLMGEMKILSHPATVDSVPTCGNQEDPVSFAYNAARKAYAIAGKLDYVLALELMVACQALDFFDPTEAAPATKAVYDLIRAGVPTLVEDRWLHPDIEYITERVRDGRIVAAVEALVGDLD